MDLGSIFYLVSSVVGWKKFLSINNFYRAYSIIIEIGWRFECINDKMMVKN